MKSEVIERVHRAMEDIAAGRMVVMVDDEQRENEGDLVMAAEHCTPEAVNFMARYGRGLICLPLDAARVERLELPLMAHGDHAKRSTAFTVSIEARHGVTTGISAADRSRTVMAAVAPDATAADLVSPGHIFPLRAVPGGVLQRAGHTEGSVDLALLAGCSPAGVICEIMKDDGTMARMPDLETFAGEHNLRILSIADLIQYRLQTETLVKRVRQAEVTLPPGKQAWKVHVYETAGQAGSNEMVALTLGEIDARPVLTRVQVGGVLSDVFGARPGSRAPTSEAVSAIEQEGRGVVLYIPPRISILQELDVLTGNGERPDSETVLRETGFGSQVLRDLGASKLRLLVHRPSRVVAAQGYGLDVVEQVLLRKPDAASEAEAEHTTH